MPSRDVSIVAGMYIYVMQSHYNSCIFAGYSRVLHRSNGYLHVTGILNMTLI